MKTKRPKKSPNEATKLVRVYFEFNDPNAKSVCIAGTFNNWKPERKILCASGVGNWWKEFFLPPGTYEYCLVVDGKWISDPLAKAFVPNPFGGTNSVLTVYETSEEAHLIEAEKLPLKNTGKPIYKTVH